MRVQQQTKHTTSTKQDEHKLTFTHTPTNKKTKKTKQHRKNVLAKHRIGIGGAAHSNPTKKKAIKIEVGECDKVSIHMHITHILPREY